MRTEFDEENEIRYSKQSKDGKEFCYCCHHYVTWRVTGGVCWSCEDTPIGKMIKQLGLRNYLNSKQDGE